MPHSTWRKWLPKTVQKEQQSPPPPPPKKGEKRPFTWRKRPQLEGGKAPEIEIVFYVGGTCAYSPLHPAGAYGLM